MAENKPNKSMEEHKRQLIRDIITKLNRLKESIGGMPASALDALRTICAHPLAIEPIHSERISASVTFDSEEAFGAEASTISADETVSVSDIADSVRLSISASSTCAPLTPLKPLQIIGDYYESSLPELPPKRLCERDSRESYPYEAPSKIKGTPQPPEKGLSKWDGEMDLRTPLSTVQPVEVPKSKKLTESKADDYASDFLLDSPPTTPPSGFGDTAQPTDMVSPSACRTEDDEALGKCVVCETFDIVLRQTDEVHLSWLLCQFFIASHMHNICTWDANTAKPQSNYWRIRDVEKSRQTFDRKVEKYLQELEYDALITLIRKRLKKFKKLLLVHTPTEHAYSYEKCVKYLTILQDEYKHMFSVRMSVLQYLLKETKRYRHNPCHTFTDSVKWFQNCTHEITYGLREFEINLENLHLGRLVWSRTMKEKSSKT